MINLNDRGKKLVREANQAGEAIHLGCQSQEQERRWKLYKRIEEILTREGKEILFGYVASPLGGRGLSIESATARKVLEADGTLDLIKIAIFEEEEKGHV
jgi:hypothetical protein